MNKLGDIDIDLASNTKKEKYGVRAIIYNEETKTITAHPSGYYIDSNIPVDEITQHAAIDYKEAEILGYTKIDLLTNTFYDVFSSKDDVLASIRDPDWSLLLNEDVIKTIPHLHSYGDLLQLIAPTDIETLADILAMIRPGKMKYLDKYLKNKNSVRKNLYRRGINGYAFKRSHAIATATQIVAFVNHTRGTLLVTF